MEPASQQNTRAELRQLRQHLRASMRSLAVLWRLTWRWLLWMGLTAVSLIPILATLTAFVPLLAPTSRILRRLNWAAELSSHFRFHYFLLLFLFTVLFILGRHRRRAGLTAVFTLTNLALILPFYITPVTTATANTPTYRAVNLNVRAYNTEYDTVLTFLTDTQPDLIVLLEAHHTDWENALEPLRQRYPYNNLSESGRYDGTLIFSRFPFANSSGIRDIPDPFRLSAIGQFQLTPSQQLTVAAVHPRSPMAVGRMEQRNDHLLSLATNLATQPKPLLLLGDMNTTPWSPIFRELEKESGLRNGRLGFGLIATWPTPLGSFGIPIDHALVSPEITIHQFQRGPAVGSDHYPIIVDFSINSAATGN
jgi:endonuclease/exonuclease/phosphatase (EEP) superfamily protein YafD